MIDNNDISASMLMMNLYMNNYDNISWSVGGDIIGFSAMCAECDLPMKYIRKKGVYWCDLCDNYVHSYNAFRMTSHGFNPADKVCPECGLLMKHNREIEVHLCILCDTPVYSYNTFRMTSHGFNPADDWQQDDQDQGRARTEPARFPD